MDVSADNVLLTLSKVRLKMAMHVAFLSFCWYFRCHALVPNSLPPPLDVPNLTLAATPGCTDDVAASLCWVPKS